MTYDYEPMAQTLDESPAWTDQSRDEFPIMAIHCSGSDSSQWRHLKERLGEDKELLLPNLAGPEALSKGWSMETYSLAEEAKPLVAKLCQQPGPVHLIGHSYGAAVALSIALKHTDLVASLYLYEPTLFSLLQSSTKADTELFEEIMNLAASIQTAVDEGCDEFAAQVFTDFWGGVGAWQALRRDRRQQVKDWVAKCPLDFGALLFEPSMPLEAFEKPVSLIVGSQTRPQTERIAEILELKLPAVTRYNIEGAGHLGPFTFREKVSELLKSHLKAVNPHQI